MAGKNTSQLVLAEGQDVSGNHRPILTDEIGRQYVLLSEPVSTTLKDPDGNPIASHQNADGDYHLGTAVIQNILSSTKNYTAANLAGAATFTGAGEETFGINGIQVFSTADKDITIYIDQSTDINFTDSTKTLINSFLCYANDPCARVFASMAPYYRLRVINTDPEGGTTSKLEVATGMTPSKIENENTGDSIIDVAFDCVGMYIARQGELRTEVTSYAQDGVVAAVTLKQGAGNLHGAIFGDVVANSVITIYDSLTATGKVIFASGSMEKKVNPFNVNFYKLPFSIGLTMSILTQDSHVTVVYE